MNNINEDISILTTIPKYALDRISLLSKYCVCHYLEDTKLKKEEVTSIDIGLGELLIKEEQDTIRYKFIPARSLEKAIIETLKTGESPLINEAENIFIDRIIHTYKDLL